MIKDLVSYQHSLAFRFLTCVCVLYVSYLVCWQLFVSAKALCHGRLHGVSVKIMI